jgi:predicted P-loop ATPase
VEALKWFLTLETVTVRRPYGHFDLDKPALASFIGTVNDDGAGFLTDVTGNRRFRPTSLTTIN